MPSPPHLPASQENDPERSVSGTSDSPARKNSSSEESWKQELSEKQPFSDGQDLENWREDALESSEDPANYAAFENFSQPEGSNGVIEDMATLALNRPLDASLNHSLGGSAERNFAHGSLPATHASWQQMSDAEVMLLVRDGDDAGFNFLIAKYQRSIVRFMYRMVHNQAVAEELAQEVFLRVYRSRQTYRAEARFSTWLYRIATNLGVNHARDTKYERTASNIYLDAPDAETGTKPDLADSTPSVEQSILRQERLNAIRQQVMALPERQRMAVLMHKYQEMDYKQIGEVLKLSESATKSLLFRAYQTLRERLKDFV